MSLFRWFQHDDGASAGMIDEPQGRVGGGLSIMAAGRPCLAWDVSLKLRVSLASSSVLASFDRLGFEQVSISVDPSVLYSTM